MAEQYLQARGYEITTKKIGGNVTVEEFFASVPEGVKTVPQIYINGNYVGGYTELLKYDSI